MFPAHLINHFIQFASVRAGFRLSRTLRLLGILALVMLGVPAAAPAQNAASAQRRAQAFLNARQSSPEGTTRPAEAAAMARQQHLELSRQAAEQAAQALRRRAVPSATGSFIKTKRVSPEISATTPLTTAWQPVGPMQVNTAAYGLVTGRVSSVAIDPADATGNTIYLGTTGGGVWKSMNAAGAAGPVSFSPLTDALSVFSANAGAAGKSSISIGAVTVQPGGTGVLLAGTGDPNDASDSYYGVGVLRSADNGVTWSLQTLSQDGVGGAHSFAGEGFAGFAWSGASPNLVVAAVSNAAEGTVVNASTSGASARGLFYSTDAGNTWQMATLKDGSATVQSGQSDFTTYEGNAVTAVVWNPVRQRFYAAVRFHGYYESVDGTTWTRMLNQPGSGLSAANCPSRAGTTGLTSCPMFRGSLAVQPASGDLFALTVDASNRDGGLYQDVCAANGSNCSSATVLWANRLNSSPLDDSAGTIPQGDYNLALAAVPAATALSTSDTLLFAGVGDLFRCRLSDGCSLRNTTNAARHCLSVEQRQLRHPVALLRQRRRPVALN